MLVEGETNLFIKKYEEAIKDFNQVIETNSTNDWVYYQRALIHLVNNNASEANIDLGLAIELSSTKYQKDPKDWRNMFNLALYYLTIANYKVSKQFYNDALKEDVPTDLKNDATDDLDKFISLFPKNKHAKAMRKLFE